MVATKNAHDWHCEDHDTYGWRGEECRKCPTAPSEADALRNELSLARQRVATLEADREKLLQLLESAVEVIGRFVSDEGWAQSDMDTMDNIGAVIARMRRA